MFNYKKIFGATLLTGVFLSNSIIGKAEVVQTIPNNQTKVVNSIIQKYTEKNVSLLDALFLTINKISDIEDTDTNITIHNEKIIGEPTPVPTATPTPIPTNTPIPKPKDLHSMSVPKVSSACMSYMSYTCITSRNSPQYKLQHWEGHVKTDEKTGVRVVTDSNGIDRYCVAMGTYYGLTGTKLKIKFSNGTEIYAIIGDSKADGETDANHQYHLHDNSVVEYIVGNADTYREKHQENGLFISNSYVTEVIYQGFENNF